MEESLEAVIQKYNRTLLAEVGQEMAKAINRKVDEDFGELRHLGSPFACAGIKYEYQIRQHLRALRGRTPQGV